MEAILKHYFSHVSLLGVALCASLLFFACSKDESTKNSVPEKAVLLTPANKLTGVNIDQLNLEWQSASDPDGDAVVYDLYLDTESSPQTKVIGDLKANSYKLQTDLDFETTYYWRVVARDGKGGSSESDIYSFTTREATIRELIIGKWTIINFILSGTPLDWDECRQRSSLQFFEDGSIIVEGYSGAPCELQNRDKGTYTITGNILSVSVDNESDSFQIMSIYNTGMKLRFGDYMYVLTRAQ